MLRASVLSRLFRQQNAGRKGCKRNQARRQLQGTKGRNITMRLLKRNEHFFKAALFRNMN